ncbi:MAG: DUF4135 domain-containing protein [Eubacteriales bacterium]|nr:DUF4135 domain-containing protein [Eubacteriales bacterium]
MEELFSKSEYEQLLKSALWSDEETVSCEPAWMEELKKLSRYFRLQPFRSTMSARVQNMEASRVFFDVFRLYIEEAAEKRCAERSVNINKLLAPGALLAYEDGIADYCTGHWSSVCNTVLKEAGYNPFQVCSDPKALEYILCGKCFHDCCLAYPMFARLFAEYLLSSVDELSALICILSEQRKPVYLHLCDPNASEESVPKVLSIGESVSDRHSGGRSVHIITFSNGKKVVFKPHSSQIDIAFSGWLDFLANAAGEEAFEAADTIDYGSYSFYRFVSPYSFQSEEEIARFFYREGFLLGAVYSLGGRDLHCENIIAMSDPVVVDGEALIEVPENSDDNIFYVMSATLLPLCSSQPGYHKELCGACDTCKGSANLPVLNGRTFSAYDFPCEMISGFTAAMEAVLKNMPAAADTVRRLFTGVPTRKIILPSYSYEYTLLALNTPRRLRNSTEAEHVMNILLERKAEKDGEISKRETRIGIERTALRHLDIPMLYVTLDSDSIEKVISHMEKIDRRDLEQQQKYMRFLIDKNCSLRLARAGTAPDPSDNDVLRALAKDTLAGFSGVYHIAVPREDYEPCFTLGGAAFMEGKLGAAVALTGYLTCFEATGEPLCKTIRRKLDKYISGLSVHKDDRKAFSILEPGLAEGMGGMLSGAYLLFKAGMIGEEPFRAVAEGILHSTEQALDRGRVFSFSHSFLYGFNGLKFALDRVRFLGGLPDELSERTRTAAARLGREISYPDASAKAMLRAELDEAYLRFDSSVLVRELSIPFPGLFYGTSGKLLRLCAERYRQDSPEKELPLFEFFKV